MQLDDTMAVAWGRRRLAPSTEAGQSLAVERGSSVRAEPHPRW
jgi:hypothetical protein